jgi:nucleotide-binding universal stress UspA family protein
VAQVRAMLMTKQQRRDRRRRSRGEKAYERKSFEMSTKIIISYDGTHNEDDAVALGRLLAGAGAEISLAYVRHTQEADIDRETLAQGEAQELLARGAALLGEETAQCHVVTDRSTPEGLSALARELDAQAIVFCSDSHTAKGHVTIGNSAARLLDGGSTAIAIAPAGFASGGEGAVERILVTGDGSAHESAEDLARALGGEVHTEVDGPADLLVVGSRPEAPLGRVSISAASENLVENATCPVLILAHGRALAFDGLGAALA